MNDVHNAGTVFPFRHIPAAIRPPWREPRRALDKRMAFLQSAPPRQPFFRAPPVVLWLIGGLAALHLARVTRPGDQPDNLVYEFGLYPLRYSRAFLESHM